MKLPYDCFTYRLWVDLEPTTDCRWSRAVLVVEDPVKGEEIQLICAVYRAMNPGLGIKWFFGPSLPHGNDVIFPYWTKSPVSRKIGRAFCVVSHETFCPNTVENVSHETICSTIQLIVNTHNQLETLFTKKLDKSFLFTMFPRYKMNCLTKNLRTKYLRSALTAPTEARAKTKQDVINYTLNSPPSCLTL